MPLPLQAKLDDGSLVRLLSAWVDLSATREMNAEVRPAQLSAAVREGRGALMRYATLDGFPSRLPGGQGGDP